MGESYRAMMEDTVGIEDSSGDYMHDIRLLREGVTHNTIPLTHYMQRNTAYTHPTHLVNINKGVGSENFVGVPKVSKTPYYLSTISVLRTNSVLTQY